MKKELLIQCICMLIFVMPLYIINAQNTKTEIDSLQQVEIDKLFEPWNNTNTPGAAIAIIENDQIIYKKAFGNSNLEFGVRNTPATLFNIASNSKQFTAYALINLVEEGKISLDDDIHKYLPELPDFTKKIKVSTLAQHTHGIRGITYLLGMAGWHIEDVITRKAVLKLLMHQEELDFEPETDFSYNNSGYMLLAEIIERVSGRPFHKYLKDIIFKPLEMNNTVLFEDYEKVIPNLSNPYYFDGEAYKKGIRNSKDIVGNTGIRTNIEDLSKWVINFEKRIIGNEKIFKKLREEAISKSGDSLGYSFGQIVSSYKGREVISHGGADVGYRSQILRFPQEKVSVIVLTNDGALNADEKAHRIADIYFDDLKKIGESEVNQLENGTRIVSRKNLERYEGKFELQPGFILEFTKKEDQLFITATGQGTLPLEMLNDYQFQIRRISAIVTFIKNDTDTFDEISFAHEGQVSKGNRIKFKMKETDMEKYVGRYYSNELETSYQLLIQNGILTAIHQRQEETKLTPIDTLKFSGNTWFFGMFDFVIKNNQISGFRVSSDRAKNIWFERVEEL